MSLVSLTRSAITGGNFTQVTHNNFNSQPRSLQAQDRLQAAVAPTALHNSAERFDPPRCHPNTRVAVMDELIDWVIRRGDSGSARVLWLSGPAGAGKSAIAQSLCELCFAQKFLLASFIFNRSDPLRNNSKRLVATIVSQIYAMVPQHHQSLILGVIDNNPLVFDRSIEDQFKALIMEPLCDLFEVDHFNNYDAPRLIVIDGLDECSPRASQINILKAVQTISTQRSSPFIFLIASRPEHDIQMFFRCSSLGYLFRRLDLDDSYRPDLDIELFLTDKLQKACTTHPLKESIPQGWPPSSTIRELVKKSSGQFIYASVVIKYVTSDRQYPPNRLDVVLGLRPPKRDLPFAELDMLYSHIFSCVDGLNLVLQILCIVILLEHVSPSDIELLCDLDQGDCVNALCDLRSVVQIRPPEQDIYLLHKSLSDYLQDPSRSHRYYIDTTPKTVIPLVVRCLQVLSDPNLEYNTNCAWFVLKNHRLLVRNIAMCHDDLMSVSLMDYQKNSIHASDMESGSLSVSFTILNDVCTLQDTEYDYIYRHYLGKYAELVHRWPQIYEFGTDENTWYLFPIITSFILLATPENHISSQLFDILRPLGSFSRLSQIICRPQSMADYPDLSYIVAQRCIKCLIYDQHSSSATFALECLSLILPYSKLSADLDEGCRLLRSLLDYTYKGRSLAYDFMGRPYAELGHTDAEIFKMTEGHKNEACVVMWEYTDGYARRTLPWITSDTD